jgi:hypothetical protein
MNSSEVPFFDLVPAPDNLFVQYENAFKRLWKATADNALPIDMGSSLTSHR